MADKINCVLQHDAVGVSSSNERMKTQVRAA
jgi:hypothetical protein